MSDQEITGVGDSVLTSDRHDCGAPIYKVGKERKRFCVRCSSKVEE